MDGPTQFSERRTVQLQRQLIITDYILDDLDFVKRGLRNNIPDGAREPAVVGKRSGSAQTESGLGRLQMLPSEILTEILLELDIPSLTICRPVSSKFANFFFESSPPGNWSYKVASGHES